MCCQCEISNHKFYFTLKVVEEKLLLYQKSNDVRHSDDEKVKGFELKCVQLQQQIYEMEVSNDLDFRMLVLYNYLGIGQLQCD